MEKYISPQTKILKVIVDNGGSASTNIIMEKTGIARIYIHANGRHLLSRGLAKKVTVPKSTGGYSSTWHINPNRIDKVLSMIREAYEDGSEFEQD